MIFCYSSLNKDTHTHKHTHLFSYQLDKEHNNREMGKVMKTVYKRTINAEQIYEYVQA